MSTDNFTQDVHARLARVGKALSHGNRLEDGFPEWKASALLVEA